MSIQALRNKRVEIANKMKAHVELSGAWDADRQTQFENMKAEIEAVDQQIAAIQNVLDREQADAAAIGDIQNRQHVSEDQAHAIRDLDKHMFTAWARDGREGMSQEMARVQDQRLLAIRNEMSTSTGSAGGYVVAPEFARTLLEALKKTGSVRSVAKVIQTQSGAPISFPTTDATSEEGEIIPENGQASDDDADFGTLSLATHKFSSKVVTVPWELLQDSAIDLESHVRGRLEQRLRRVTERFFLLGSGVSQPAGLLVKAQAGKVGATGKSVSFEYGDLLALKHSVDPAYREGSNCRFMFNDQTLLFLKQMKDTTGRPLWLPGIALNAPDTIDGDGFVINQFMPDMAANNKSVLYGDFGHYTVRDVMQMLLFRFADSAYTKKGQVGFLAWMRSGGNLLDVGGAVKYWQHSAT